MHHPALRHAPATPLTALLCLVTVVLTAGAAPANAAAPLASTDEEKVTIEIDIKSDDEVTTTFLATAPSDGEQTLKDFCTEENCSTDTATPKVTFSSKNGTPTCTAVITGSVSENEYVTHDGDEYVVDTAVASASEEDKESSLTLSVVFPGKVTDAGGGTIEGEHKNKVSFDSFYDNKARGRDTAEAAVKESSGNAGLWIIIILMLMVVAASGVIALISNSARKNREQKYLAALEQQSFNAAAAAPMYQPFPYTSPTPPVGAPPQPQVYYPQAPQQSGYPPSQMPPVGQAGYLGAPQPYQQPPGSPPPGAGGPYPPPGQGIYGGG